ncbi:acetolactate synthase large subunit [Geothermobacter hydrogeniphilus]|uniref:Acetolactate synthase large subunit n=1 Tax=Geothermobacter hydrogeniphilus TaxID=1969733 RepID=A0A1X0XSL4_9BACT|nr:acetolactate synthase large subunit [Geothermobacter hydrogeniphilus]ORJ55856.1 acetolactate synthase large subunit [Geothermobacter hydrogeniphilus]
MNASDLLVKALENEGVEVIYGVPGEENLDFLEALRQSHIELILTRHEQGAAFMAATYGRLTGKPGVCLATLGPGATNLVTGAAYAQLGAFPMVMITGQKPIKASKQGQFQIVDVVEMMRPLTKYTRQIVNVTLIPSTVREAFRLSQEERPGAVHLELPEDIAREPVDKTTTPVFQISRNRRPCAAERLVVQAADMIRAAEYPLLLIGAGANRNRVRSALRRFVEETGIYFFNTQMGKGVVDENSPQCLGTAALSDNDYIHCAIERADLVINVGHDVVEKPPFFMEHGGKQVIHVNFSSASVDNVYFPQLSVVGDIADSMSRMTIEVGRLEKDQSAFRQVKESLDIHLRELADDPSFPVKPQRLVADVRRVMPHNGVIALDNGVYKIWFARNYPALEPNTVLLDNALASMGAGLPSAMEVARLYPDRRVMAICGDGGLMMNSQELETARRLGLNLVVLVLNDGSYGMIRWKQYAMGFEDFGLQFGNPDFVLHARSYGIGGHRVEKAEDFAPLLEQCFTAGGVHLIDLPVDYSENNRVLIDELRHKVCRI